MKPPQEILAEWADPETGGTMPREVREAALSVLAEVGRLRAALEKLTVDEPLQGRVFKGNTELPDAGDFYRAYNAGILAQFEYSSAKARAALWDER